MEESKEHEGYKKCLEECSTSWVDGKSHLALKDEGKAGWRETKTNLDIVSLGPLLSG